MTSSNIVGMESVDLGSTRLRRNHIIPAHYRTEEIDRAYDDTTLWYDAVWSNGVLQLICPPILGLEKVLKRGALLLDGKPLQTMRRMRFKYFETINIKSSEKPGRVEVTVDGKEMSSGVSEGNSEFFCGLNTIVVKSKNNALQWISDFALFHRKTQNAQAILFFDNGSDEYSLAEVYEVLSAAGLKAVVVNAAFPFGPDVKNGGAAWRNRAQFFQHAVLNIAKRRFLSKARAVASLDIDELVWSEGGNVFDKAVNNPFGYITFRGFWRYPDPAATPPLRHADHIWGNAKSSKVGRLPPAIKKYVVVPDRLFGRQVWSVHRVGFPRSENLFERRDCGFWHCSGISNGWRYKSRLHDVGGKFIDEDFILKTSPLKMGETIR